MSEEEDLAKIVVHASCGLQIKPTVRFLFIGGDFSLVLYLAFSLAFIPLVNRGNVIDSAYQIHVCS
jgi:hypothetical protein